MPYPEINIKVPSTAKLSVTYLKGYRHFVVFVELLMKTFSPMSSKLNIVCHC